MTISRMLDVMGSDVARSRGSETAIYLPLLYAMALNVDGMIVECGVRTGVTTVPLLAAARARGRMLCSIDVVDCKAEAIKTLGGDSPHWWFVQGNSWEEAIRFKDGSVGLVFLDTSHEESYTLGELDAWLPKLGADGILCGHDLSLKGGGVRAAVEEFGARAEMGDRFKLLTFEESRGFFAFIPRG